MFVVLEFVAIFAGVIANIAVVVAVLKMPINNDLLALSKLFRIPFGCPASQVPYP